MYEYLVSFPFMNKIFTVKRLFIACGLLVGFIVLASLGGIAWLVQSSSAVDPAATQTVRFVIPKGQSIKKIGDELVAQKLIRSTVAFRYTIWKNHLTQKIQAGTFDLSPSMTTEELAQKLTTGTNDIKVTIPEGKRVEEVAEYFKDFEGFDSIEFLKLSKKDEGYLFPDTYLFPAQADAATVHSLLRKTFDKVATDNKFEQKAKKSERSLSDIVILASILEREAKSAEDMKMVAGILYNRLDNGIALQVDATMQYVKGYDKVKKQWWTPALSEDKKLDSKYNTYKYPGLPPAPISNPGLKALEAAVSPTVSDNYYYITDNDGNMHYAETYEEHLANIEKYLN